MGNSEKGRWVTVKGKHLFISDDPYEKKEREIADSKKRADKYNQSRQEESDPVRNNALYKGLAEEADKVLSARDSDFGSLTDKSVELYRVMSAFNKAGVDRGETYEKLLKENRRIEAITHAGYVNTGRYNDELKKYNQKKSADRLKSKVDKIRRDNPNSYVTSYGVVLENPKGKTKSDVNAFKRAFEKAGEVYLIDGQAESKDNPAGIVAKYTTWKSAKPTGSGSFSWGYFKDTEEGKRKVWFYEAD